MEANAIVCSHREMLDACFFALRYFGLWSPNLSGLLKLFYVVYNKIVLGLVSTFAGTLAADLCFSFRDLIIVTDDGCFLAGIAVIIFKLITFQLRRERIEKLISEIYDPVESLRCSSDTGVITLVETFILYEKATIYCLSSMAAFLIIAVIFFVPTEDGSLPIRAKYPFDTSEDSMHRLAFAIQASAVTIGIVAIMAMDSIVIGFCRFTQLQLKVLAANYENCQNSSSPRGSLLATSKVQSTMNFFRREEDFEIRCFVPFHPKEVAVMEDNFSTRFRTCIKNHQRLIKIVDEINELFSWSILFQLCASSTMICLTGFQALLGSSGSANLMKFGLYLGTAFSQLLCWCWYGNKFIYQSDALAMGQWFSGWESEVDFSSTSVLMVISLIRTRKSMELTAGTFYTMSMETFIMILRTSYSFFALLSTMTEENLL